MKLTLAESRYIVEPISIISELVTEVKLQVEKDKLEIIAMDPANVAMIVFTLLNTTFTEYQVDKPITLAINLEQLKQILKRAKASDTISLSLGDNKLQITIAGESKRTFNLALLELDETEQKIPSLNFAAKVELNTTLLSEAIEDMGIIAESVSLAVDKDKFTIESSSNLNTAKAELTNATINLEGDLQVKAKYSLGYLKKIAKASKITDQVTLQFGKDYPLKTEYSLKDKLSLSIILAPRVENT